MTYRNNFVPASEPWLAENGQPMLRQARLNGPGLQHTLSHDAVSSPTGHFQGIPESLRQVFPVIQQRPLFSTIIGDSGQPEDFVSFGFTPDEHRQIRDWADGGKYGDVVDLLE